METFREGGRGIGLTLAIENVFEESPDPLKAFWKKSIQPIFDSVSIPAITMFHSHQIPSLRLVGSPRKAYG